MDNYFMAEMEETIRTQQAEIERLKEYEDAVYAHFDVACHSYDASKSVYDNLSMLQSWHCEIALDPKVSKPANDLHSEIALLKCHRDRLFDEFKKVRQTLEDENNNSLSAITDTIWMQEGCETLFDYMDALIAEIEAEK